MINKNSFPKIRNKKAFEMSFAWIFSIIAGAIILFLAIYITIKYVGTRSSEINVQTTARISILLDHLETSLESGKSSTISFSQETRIYNQCFDSGNFGKHSLSVVSKKGIGKEWETPEHNIQIYNKYIFSDEIEQGKDFSVFVKPLEFPFKISDLIFFSGKKYCFIMPPNDIEDELDSLNLENIELTDIIGNCSEKTEKVCFSQSSGCDIAVYGNTDFSSGSVLKNGKTLYFAGPLLYGAIFSSPEIYECNVKRLMKRVAELSAIYSEKIKITERVGCGSTLDTDLSALANLASSLKSSQDLLIIQMKVNEINDKNNIAVCRVY